MSNDVNQLHYATASQLAERVRSRRIGCLELADLFIDRIERLDPRINAVVVRDFDVARERARRLDALSPARLAGLPLAGVPMTIKESFDLIGHPTTWGLPQYRDHRATAHALAVDRLLAAGANVLGKTNVPVLLSDWQTFNPLYGTTNNPWNVERVPGGSSGGGAAALAAGLSALEVGSDIGASIRNPAHYCGVFGHKPTWGICSRRGHGMPGTTADTDISVIGPLARSAEDLRLALSVIAGPDEIDGAGWKLDLPAPRPRSLREYRVAVMDSDPAAPVDASVRGAIRSVAGFLAAEGASVDFDARPPIDTQEAHELYILLLRAATSGRMSDEQLEQLRASVAAPGALAEGYPLWLAQGATMLHRDWLKANERRHRMRMAWADFFRQWDVLLCPAAASEAFPHNQVGERWERMIRVDGVDQPSTVQLFWAGFPGLFYLPSTVAPAGLGPSGLPVGVQIVAAQHHDLTAIDLAQRIEQGFRAFTAPPGFEH